MKGLALELRDWCYMVVNW